MVAVPAMPVVTVPEADPISATDTAELLHVPPEEVVINVVLLPAHRLIVPDIAAGTRLTVTTSDVVQPAVVVYTMVAVPAATPVTTPDATLTAAVEVILLLQVPPEGVELNVVVAPSQTVSVPDKGVGIGSMLITALPVMAVVQPGVEPVASTVYVPAVVNVPKLMALPVPAKELPTVDAPLYNW